MLELRKVPAKSVGQCNYKKSATDAPCGQYWIENTEVALILDRLVPICLNCAAHAVQSGQYTWKGSSAVSSASEQPNEKQPQSDSSAGVVSISDKRTDKRLADVEQKLLRRLDWIIDTLVDKFDLEPPDFDTDDAKEKTPAAKKQSASMTPVQKLIAAHPVLKRFTEEERFKKNIAWTVVMCIMSQYEHLEDVLREVAHKLPKENQELVAALFDCDPDRNYLAFFDDSPIVASLKGKPAQVANDHDPYYFEHSQEDFEALQEQEEDYA